MQVGDKSSDSRYSSDFDLLSACSKDDQLLFYSNGKAESIEGKTKCNLDDPNMIASGYWVLRGDSLILPGNPPAKIEELTDTKLTLAVKESVFSGTYWAYIVSIW